MPDLTFSEGRRLARNNQEMALMMLSLVLMIAGSVFLYLVGRYALDGSNPFQFFADSNTYHDIYSGFRATPDSFMDVSYNFLGPLLILSVTAGNIYLIMIINVLIFTFSMIFICRTLELNPVRAAMIQLISPLTISSLLSVNKEIIAFPVLALFIGGYRYRSAALIIIATLISLLARWQLTVFCLTLIGLYFARHANRYIVLMLILGAISWVYYLAQGILEPVLLNVEISTSAYTEGSGLFERLIDLQNDGWYFLVAPIKAAHLLFSMGLRVDSIINPIVIYNDQIVGSYCFVNIVIFSVLLVKRDIVVRNDLIVVSLVYLIVFALTPVYAPRYFHAVTVLWALVLAGARGSFALDERLPSRATAYV